jgi:predicted nuclease with TOPRIM domain
MEYRQAEGWNMRQPEVDELRAENERLQEERAKREADFEPLLDEILRLRAAVEYQRLSIEAKVDEIERLRIRDA